MLQRSLLATRTGCKKTLEQCALGACGDFQSVCVTLRRVFWFLVQISRMKFRRHWCWPRVARWQQVSHLLAHTLSRYHSVTLSLFQSHTRPLSLSRSFTLYHSITQQFSHPLTLSLTLSLSLSLSLSLTLTLPLSRTLSYTHSLCRRTVT